MLSRLSLIVLGAVVWAGAALAAADAPPSGYNVQPGDVLLVSVWKEPDLQQEVLVRPDGGFSFPLAGQLNASGKTVAGIQEEMTERIARFIPEPVVTVALRQARGNQVFVLGKVNNPGAFTMTGRVDVMQALAMAGGATPFAAVNDILILRREEGVQRAIPFRYGEVAAGESLKQNIVLHGGDVVVVP